MAPIPPRQRISLDDAMAYIGNLEQPRINFLTGSKFDWIGLEATRQAAAKFGFILRRALRPSKPKPRRKESRPPSAEDLHKFVDYLNEVSAENPLCDTPLHKVHHHVVLEAIKKFEAMYPPFSIDALKETSVEDLPDWVNLYGSKQDALSELGRLSESSEVIQTIEEIIGLADEEENVCETFGNWPLKKGLILLTMDQFRRSIPAFQQATELDPTNPDIWQGLGVAQFESNVYKEAATSFRRVVELRPTDVPSLMCLGVSLCKSESYGQARDAFRRALNLDDALYTPHSHLGLAECAHGMGQSGKTIRRHLHNAFRCAAVSLPQEEREAFGLEIRDYLVRSLPGGGLDQKLKRARKIWEDWDKKRTAPSAEA